MTTQDKLVYAVGGAVVLGIVVLAVSGSDTVERRRSRALDEKIARRRTELATRWERHASEARRAAAAGRRVSAEG